MFSTLSSTLFFIATMALASPGSSEFLGSAAPSATPSAVPFLCDESSEPIVLQCDTDKKTKDIKKKDKYSLNFRGMEIEAVVKCQGSVSQMILCIGDGPMADTLGMMVGADLSMEDAFCLSFFGLSGQATKYRSTCEGPGFKIVQRLAMTRTF